MDMFVRATSAYPSDIRPITALRFFAAAAVVVHHYTRLLDNPDAYTGIFEKGYLAVDLFFILSGFILSHVYLPAAEQGTLSPRAFYGRRLARVYPVHLFALGLALTPYIAALLGGLPQLIPDTVQWRYIVSNVAMVHAWGFDDIAIFNTPSWSISAEWFAYLLFPLLAMGIMRLGVRTALLLAGGLFLGLYAVVAMLPTGEGNFLTGRLLTQRSFDFGILRIVPEFFLGMALYRFGRGWQLRMPARGPLLACVVLLLGLMHFAAPDWAIVLTCAALILLVAESARQGQEGFMAAPTLVLLGEASYSLYMLHHLWLDLIFTTVLKTVYGAAIPPVLFYGCWVALFPLALWSSLWCCRRVEQPWRQRFWGGYARFMNIR